MACCDSCTNCIPCTTPVCLVFVYADFIAEFPAFSDATIYPESLLQSFWNQAIYYISPNSVYGCLQGCARLLALYLMVAHLAYIYNLVQSGTMPYFMRDATIDKVHVGLEMPKLWNQWQWWLMLSPYGMQLYALLQAWSVGGQYIGGTAPLSGFRPNYTFPIGGNGC